MGITSTCQGWGDTLSKKKIQWLAKFCYSESCELILKVLSVFDCSCVTVFLYVRAEFVNTLFSEKSTKRPVL